MEVKVKDDGTIELSAGQPGYYMRPEELTTLELEKYIEQLKAAAKQSRSIVQARANRRKLGQY